MVRPSWPPALLLLALLAPGCTVEWNSQPWGYWASGQADLPPVLTLTAPADGVVLNAGSQVRVAGIATDDRGAVTVLVASSLDGQVATPQVAADGSFDVGVELSPGTHTVVVTATDGAGQQAFVSAVVELSNVAPSVPTVAIEPATPLEGEALQAVLVTPSVDPDGDAVSYVWSWEVDGSSQADLTTDTVPAGRTVGDQRWTVVVRASDGAAESAEATATVVVAGKGDVVVDIQPDAPSRLTPPTCSWSAPGSEVLASAAAWSVNGGAAGNASEPLTAFARGDLLRCDVTVTTPDGDITGFDETTAANAPPSVSASLSASTVREADTVTCVTTTADADGDTVTVTYRWLVNGAVSGVTGPSISGANFNKGNTLQCEATPFDGLVAGSPDLTGALTVANTAPTAPASVSLTPTAPLLGDTLTCKVVVAGTDADGDTLTTGWAWQADGVTVSGAASSTFATTGLSGGEEVNCRARHDDGTSTSAWTDSAAVRVAGGLSGALDPTDATFTVTGASKKDQFGRSLAWVDDVDADGVGDLLVGSASASSSKGGAWLFLGGTWTSSMTTADADVAWAGSGTDELGDTLAAGDADGDGVVDLVVTAPGSGAGVASVLSGADLASWSGSLAGDALATVAGATTGDDCGAAGALVDLDADGLAELALSAPLRDDAATDDGAVYVMEGADLVGGGGLSAEDSRWILVGDKASERLGQTWVADAGDLDDDGRPDLAIGVFKMANSSGTATGVALVMDGADFRPGGLKAEGSARSQAVAEIGGADSGDELGFYGAGPGDVTGDGKADLLVTARYGDGDSADSGAAWLFDGPLVGVLSATHAVATIPGGAAGELFGAAAAGGDLDGDAKGDVVVGAPWVATGSTAKVGGATLLAGSALSTWGTSPKAVFTSTTASDEAGTAVAIGDVTGDAYGELFIGAIGAGSDDQGQVFVFQGP